MIPKLNIKPNNMYMTISLGLLNGLVEEKINYLVNVLQTFSFNEIYIKFPYFKPQEKKINEELRKLLISYFSKDSVLTLSIAGNESEIRFLQEDISSTIPEATVVIERI